MRKTVTDQTARLPDRKESVKKYRMHVLACILAVFKCRFWRHGEFTYFIKGLATERMRSLLDGITVTDMQRFFQDTILQAGH